MLETIVLEAQLMIGLINKATTSQEVREIQKYYAKYSIMSQVQKALAQSFMPR